MGSLDRARRMHLISGQTSGSIEESEVSVHRMVTRLGISGDGGRKPELPNGAHLMEQVRAGDEGAFEEIVALFWADTILYATHLTRDSDLSKDLAQEAFARLWKKRSEWSGEGPVRVWLLRTVRNLFISGQRMWKVRSRWAERVGAAPLPESSTPLDDVSADELRKAIHTAVQALPPRRRETFTLVHLQGCSYREAAEVIGVRPQTVANYLQAALADLRVLLRAYLPDL